MSVARASLIRRATLSLLVGVALAIPAGAKADLLGGLSVRVGAFMPTRSTVRDITDFAAFGGGIDWKVPWVPSAFSGESWSSSLSIDFHYSQRGQESPVDTTQIYRYLPICINQVYTFEQQGAITPFAGVSLGAHTFGVGPRTHGGTGGKQAAVDRGNSVGPNPRHQPTITRPGLGLILGGNWGRSLYFEGRYDWIYGGNPSSPDGFRTYIGYRF